MSKNRINTERYRLPPGTNGRQKKGPYEMPADGELTDEEIVVVEEAKKAGRRLREVIEMEEDLHGQS